MTPLHPRLPVASWTNPRTRRRPGTLPLAMPDWLLVDEARAAQMALRDQLIAERETEANAVLPQAGAAAAEVCETVLPWQPGLGFVLSEGEALRPDG